MFRAGFIAIIGLPNAGKSTLLNALVGARLAIVTRKAQTTRRRVLGIMTESGMQVVFIDTPGILTPAYALQEAMMRAVGSAIDDADAIILVQDAQRFDPNAPLLAGERVGMDSLRGKPVILALNKVDRIRDKKGLLPQIAHYIASGLFREIVPISAERETNIDALKRAIAQFLPEHDPYYPEDMLSDQQQRFFVAEIIREKVFTAVHEEVPYASEAVIREFKEREGGKWYIAADIVVERESQKRIMIGAGGEMLKRIGARARQEIETFLDHPVYLELFVRVKEDWRNDPNALREFGYE